MLGTCMQWGSLTVSNLVHACSGGVQPPQTWYMHAVGEFNSLKLGTCIQWGSSTVSNLVHAFSGGVQQSQTWYMHAVGEFNGLRREGSACTILYLGDQARVYGLLHATLL